MHTILNKLEVSQIKRELLFCFSVYYYMKTNRNNRKTEKIMNENEYIIGQSTINTMHGKMVLNAIEDEDKMSLSYTNLKRNCYTYKNGKAYLWIKQ